MDYNFSPIEVAFKLEEKDPLALSAWKVRDGCHVSILALNKMQSRNGRRYGSSWLTLYGRCLCAELLLRHTWLCWCILLYYLTQNTDRGCLGIPDRLCTFYWRNGSTCSPKRVHSLALCFGKIQLLYCLIHDQTVVAGVYLGQECQEIHDRNM